MSPSHPVLADLPGVWRRTLAREADGSTDRVTDAVWIQGPSIFADLRQPPGLPDLVGDAHPSELDRPLLLALCEQKAFAGTLSADDGAFGWLRRIDLHPPAALPDAGTLRWQDGVLVEEGVHEDYLEHWEPVERGGTAAVLLEDPAEGSTGLLVRAGSWFGYARDRSGPLPAPLVPLREQVLGCADRAAAAALLDCEVSIGRVHADQVDGERWEILRSTLPHRVGSHLQPELGGAGDGLLIRDTDPQRRPRPRAWRPARLEGPSTLLTITAAPC
ncbi:hypothetical protein ABH930_004181 [Kitasatospora sp. GAS204A]|uniref:hypothetical protein n=1 Tax=unclassified Kitasatospora TaxID=2633591 RepID=UPI002473C949|nr:hypothetical protein [Kitasatospora sp. GAS204B]MDH6120152.1 hypothetical protein [Kitasatospora sp. GAS204B]